MSERIAERYEDMSSTGMLRLIQQRDGDIVVAVIPCMHGEDKGRAISVEFCNTGSGGGKSPRVLQALRALMEAIGEENAADPSSHRRGRRGMGVEQ